MAGRATAPVRHTCPPKPNLSAASSPIHYDGPMPKPQTAASHAAFDTLTHFVLGPIFIVNFFVAVYVAIRAPHHLALHLWLVVISVALLLMAVKMRVYSLRVQDRLIRVEERLRIAALAPTVDASRLTIPQLIALRFAPDEELPALVERTLAENLDPKSIKNSIQTWRPDYARI